MFKKVKTPKPETYEISLVCDCGESFKLPHQLSKHVRQHLTSLGEIYLDDSYSTYYLYVAETEEDVANLKIIARGSISVLGTYVLKTEPCLDFLWACAKEDFIKEVKDRVTDFDNQRKEIEEQCLEAGKLLSLVLGGEGTVE